MPALSLVGVPGLLLGVVSDSWWLWEYFATGLFNYLEWLPNWTISFIQQVALSALALSLLAPVLGLVACSLFVASPDRPDAELRVYSVGAGQAVTLVTKNHTVLMDAGPAQPGQIGAIGRELHGDLRRLGIRSLDLVLLSHGDADHAGGLEGLQARFHLQQLVSGEPDRVSNTGVCYRGQTWQFDAINIRVMWGGPPAEKNAASCALELTGPFGRLWILGDLPKRQQWEMARVEGLPQLDGLIAAHHGAIDGFSHSIAQMQKPRWVVFSQNSHGRWQHPHPDVVAGWQRVNAKTYLTGDVGTVVLDLMAPDVLPTHPAEYSPWHRILDHRGRATVSQ